MDPTPRVTCRPATHMLSAGTPHPARAFGAPPPPRPGAGAVLAISGEQPCPGWSWCATVLWSSPGSPHVLDRGDIATGGGADGEGELVPPPLSPTLQPSYFSPAPTPPAPPAGRLPILLSAPPPRPRLRRSSPAPRGGQGQCVAISGEQPCPGRCLVGNRALVFSGISPCRGPCGYRRGGRRLAGRGNEFPLPCLSRFKHLSSLPPPPAPPAWVRAIPMMVRDKPCPRELLASIPGKDRE